MTARDAAEHPTAVIEALGRALTGANERQVIHAVGVIDVLVDRGDADAVIAPVRPRLRRLKPPRPLRFQRVLLYPLNPLIVAPMLWRANEAVLPRNGLVRMAHHVRHVMGAEAQTIEAELIGRTTADTALIEQAGRRLWPAAAQVLAGIDDIPGLRAEVGQRHQRRLAQTTAALLREAPLILALIAETADGLLPPRLDVFDGIAARLAAADTAALSMFLTVLLMRVPQAAAMLDQTRPGGTLALIRTARAQAIRALLRRLDNDLDIEAQIAAGSLADAGAAARRIGTFLRQVGDVREWREHSRSLRQRLNAACRARLAEDLDRLLLAPLRQAGEGLDSDAVTALEATARGLCVLEDTARAAGGGAGYDGILRQAAQTVGSAIFADRIGLTDRLRLIEILAGSDAALASLDRFQSSQGHAEPG